MNDTIIGWIRTLVPSVVGVVVTWAAARGIDVDAEGLVVVLYGVITSIYYLIVRALEKKWPKVGILLGVPKTPTYNAV